MTQPTDHDPEPVRPPGPGEQAELAALRGALRVQASRIVDLERRLRHLEATNAPPATSPPPHSHPPRPATPPVQPGPAPATLPRSTAPTPPTHTPNQPATPIPPPVPPAQAPPRARIIDERIEEPPQPTPPSPRASDASWEAKFATRWLLPIGGVFLLVGAAFTAAVVGTRFGPAARVALGYAAAGVLLGGGWFLRDRSVPASRATRVIGLALAFFVSFAAHFASPMQVFANPLPAILLMAVFAGAIGLLSERWQSESTAALGFGLAILAVLASARVGQSYALAGLVIITLAATVLLVRNEWRRLSVLAVAGTYGAFVILWVILPLGRTAGDLSSNLAALVLAYAAFTAAFWRWGRVWVARERAAEQAPEDFAIPDYKPARLPYSTAFAIGNSGAFIALSTALFLVTGVAPGKIWILFATVGLAELARTAIPALRRGGLGALHATFALGLLAAASAARFSGMAEILALSALALAAAITTSRVRFLAWVRPLTAACPFIAAIGASLGWNPSTAPVFAGFIASGLLLCASGAPWERLFVRRPVPLGGESKASRASFAAIDGLSAAFRIVVGLLLMAAAIAEFLDGPSAILAGSLVIFAATALAASLRSLPWFPAAAMASLAVVFGILDPALHGLAGSLTAIAWITVFAFLWEYAQRSLDHRWTRNAAGVTGVFLAIPLVLYTYHSIAGDFGAMAGFSIACLGAIVASSNWAVRALPPFPRLGVAFDDGQDLGSPPPGATVQPIDHVLHLATALGLGLLATGTLRTLFADVQHSLPALLGITLLYAIPAGMLEWRRAGRGIPSAALGFLALGVLALGAMGNNTLEASAILLLSIVAAAVLFVGIRRDTPLSLAGFAGLAAVPLLVLLRRIEPGGAGTTAALALDTIGCLAPLAAPAVVALLSRSATQPDQGILATARIALPILSALAIAVTLTNEALLSGRIVTAAWVATGALMLALGFALRDQPLRLTAFAVFGCAVIRFLLHDLTGMDLLTRAIASLAVGAVFILAGIAYAVAMARTRAAQDQDPDPAAPAPGAGDFLTEAEATAPSPVSGQEGDISLATRGDAENNQGSSQ